MKLWQRNLILLIIVVIIAAVPLLIIKDSEFGGADGQAEEAISEINPEYEAWFDPIFELPGSEMESLLFVVQAAIGAGVVGFIMGRLTAKGKPGEQKQAQAECGERCAAN